MRTLLFLALTLIASFSLTACGWIGPYQRPLHHGHQFEVEQIERLQPGMSPTQVVQILGTPLLPSERTDAELILSYPLDLGDRQTEIWQLTFVNEQLQEFDLPESFE